MCYAKKSFKEVFSVLFLGEWFRKIRLKSLLQGFLLNGVKSFKKSVDTIFRVFIYFLPICVNVSENGARTPIC